MNSTKKQKEKQVSKTKVNAQELFFDILKRERAETGRIYIMNIDHCPILTHHLKIEF